jgi:hypothetical protein
MIFRNLGWSVFGIRGVDMRVIRNLQVELKWTCRDLFRSAGLPEGAEAGRSPYPGWEDLLDRACARIRAALQAKGGTVEILRIEKKGGSARLYWRGRLSPEARAFVEAAIALAEARSGCTCELCGKEGSLRRAGDDLSTHCDNHAEGALVRIFPGFENLHIVRHLDEFLPPAIQCRRYDRETDSFVEVDPSSLRKEE